VTFVSDKAIEIQRRR